MTKNIDKENTTTINLYTPNANITNNVYAPSNTHIDKMEVNTSKETSVGKEIVTKVAVSATLGLLGIPFA